MGTSPRRRRRSTPLSTHRSTVRSSITALAVQARVVQTWRRTRLRWTDEKDALDGYEGWQTLTRKALAQIPDLILGAYVTVWPHDQYTSARIGGPEAAVYLGTRLPLQAAEPAT
ncbi:hypothetical protein GCM10023317_96920 [Actinopolymorpha pittospori]